LTGLQLGAGAGVLTEELREGPEQTAEIGSADLARNPQGLDDAIGDRIGK
jgi:hypothetical protein